MLVSRFFFSFAVTYKRCYVKHNVQDALLGRSYVFNLRSLVLHNVMF